MNKADSILIYRTGQLGDTICAIPAMRAIKNTYRDARIIFLYDVHSERSLPDSRDIVIDLDIFDRYIPYDPKKLSSTKYLINLFSEIQKEKIDILFYFLQGKRSRIQKLRDLLVFKSGGIKKIIGMNDNYSEPIHETDRLLKILKQVHIAPDKVSFDLPIRSDHIKRIDRLWAEDNISSVPVIAIGAGSKMPLKRWPLERFETVGHSLIKEHKAFLIVLGGAEDGEAGDYLVNTWGRSKSTNWAGKTSYMESAEVLKRCNLYLGNDTGTMHLAAAVGTQCVAIFSARDLKYKWYPYGSNHIVLRQDVPCQHCMLEMCVENKMECILSISEEAVIKACQNVLERRYDHLPNMI